MLSASEPCSYPLGLCICLAAHLSARQQTALKRLQVKAHRRKLATPSLANTRNSQNSINKLAKLLNSSRPNRKPDYLVLRNSSIKLLLWKISAKFNNRTTVNAKHNLL